MTSSESCDEWLSFTIDINFITRTSFARVGPFLLSQLVRPDHLCQTYVVRPDHLCTRTKYFVTEHKIIVKPCQSRDFPLSYAVIATIDHLFFHYFYCLGVTIQWTGLLDWNTGLDYWTDMFLVFAHSMVGFMESC